jgi:hypothetical protein
LGKIKKNNQFFCSFNVFEYGSNFEFSGARFLMETDPMDAAKNGELEESLDTARDN